MSYSKNENIVNILKDMLSILGIEFTNLENLIDTELLRTDIIRQEVFNHFQNQQEKLKDLGYKTGNLTSLHKNNHMKQKWPAINMLRQVLKCNNLHLKPLIKSDGYDKTTGRKNTIRYYVITKLK
tara:strand:+ start:5237 stop:5611 length:375 start_codon:yes stop_codon:yes gene_type:complete